MGHGPSTIAPVASSRRRFGHEALIGDKGGEAEQVRNLFSAPAAGRTRTIRRGPELWMMF